MRKFIGTGLIVLGVLLIVCAAVMTGNHLLTRKQAGENAAAVLDQLDIPVISEHTEYTPMVEVPHYVLNPEMGMPEKVIDGVAYIGTLDIPALQLSLPVISSTTRDYLQIAPCRFTGSAYLDNLVIGAHNYPAHFGQIGDLSYGDHVELTDMDGNRFLYQVADIEILQPDQADYLTSGEWPLSLYTCTIGGRTRVTVRCDAVENR